MQYINKQPNPGLGTNIIDEFLNTCWVDAEYITAYYDNLPKHPIRQFLINEQNGMCCYCMKKLADNHTTTLEHIVPHHCDVNEFNNYTFPIITQNVVHLSLFNRITQFVVPGTYPHDIAYHNLLASCDSKSHCNKFRGDRFISSLFYDSLVAKRVEYDKEGNVYSTQYFDDLEIVGISTNSLLILLRKIWYELAMKKETLEDVTEDDILEVIAEITVADKFQTTINDFWGNPSKKTDLLDYDWFFNYYKNQLNSN